MPRSDSLLLSGLKAVGGALAATLLVRSAALALVDIPPEFPPLDGPGPTIFFTVVLGLMAVGVFSFVRGRAKHPRRLFRLIAAVALALSFLPDLAMLRPGAADVFPGATPAGVSILMTMHVAAAVVIVWALTGGTRDEDPS